MCVCVCVCEWAYGTGYDERRRQGLAGPEMMAIREEKARAIAAEAYEQKRAERLAAGLPTEDFEAPFGAQCCDTLLFARRGEWLRYVYRLVSSARESVLNIRVRVRLKMIHY